MEKPVDIEMLEGDAQVWPSKESINKIGINDREHLSCKYCVVSGELGSGTYATVKEIIHIDSGYHYAVKIIKKNMMSGREQLIQNEISVLNYISKFNHKNLLMLNDYFETNDDLYLITDLCTGGDLFDKITESGSYYEEDAVHIIKSLTSLVLFLHDNHIIHRDLKSENLIFKTRSIKSDILIADFGLAKVYNDPSEKLSLLCGTLSYVAPEVLIQKYSLPDLLKDEEQRLVYRDFKIRGYSYPVDVWSIGVLTYFILCGYMPFDCETDEETREAIITGDYFYEPEEYWSDISLVARDFINRCFNLNPDKRITMADLNTHLFLTLPSQSKVDLLPRVRSNYSLHKMNRSPRQSPINTPSKLSPQQSFTNVQDILKRTTSASSMISFNRLDQSLMTLNQQQRSQLYLPVSSTFTKKPSTQPGDLMESITSALMKPSTSQLSYHQHPKKTYLEESRKILSSADLRMNGVLSEVPGVIEMENLMIKSEAVSRLNSFILTPGNEKKFFI